MDIMTKLKGITIIGGLLVGALIMGNTPDLVTPSEESQLMKAEHEAFINELNAKQSRLRSQMESTMNENERMKREILSEQEELQMQQQRIKNSHASSMDSIKAEQARIESLKDEKPRIGNVEW